MLMVRALTEFFKFVMRYISVHPRIIFSHEFTCKGKLGSKYALSKIC